MGERENWAHVASGLGLGIYFGPKYLPECAFHPLKHSLYATQGAMYEPTHAGFLGFRVTDGAFWAHGEQNGVEVIAGIPWESVSTTDADGSSSSRDEPRTTVVARIHPPLLLGFRYRSRAGLFSRNIEAIEPLRAQELFRPLMNDGTDCVVQVQRAIDNNFRVEVTDTTVSLVAEEIRTRELRMLIDGAALIATRFAQARRALPPNAVERMMIDSWSAIARAEGLTFDASSFMLYGRLHDVDVTVALWAERNLYVTDFRVRVARPFDTIRALSIRREQKFAFFTKWLHHEVQVGDEAFDKEFFIDGSPDDAVRALLNPAARAAVRDVLSWSTAITFRRDMIWVHVPSPVYDANAMRRCAFGIAALGAAVSMPPTASPYRA
jgi:hypothetical protein